MRWIRGFCLLAVFCAVASAQFGNNAQKLRSTSICSPLTPLSGSALVWNGSCWGVSSLATLGANTFTGAQTINGNINMGTYSIYAHGVYSNALLTQGTATSWPNTTGSTFNGSLRLQGSGGGVMDFGNAPGGMTWIQSQGAGDFTAHYALLLQPNGGGVAIGSTTDPGTGNLSVNGTYKSGTLHSTTGTRYVCIDTTGTMTASATACSGT